LFTCTRDFMQYAGLWEDVSGLLWQESCRLLTKSDANFKTSKFKGWGQVIISTPVIPTGVYPVIPTMPIPHRALLFDDRPTEPAVAIG